MSFGKAGTLLVAATFGVMAMASGASAMGQGFNAEQKAVFKQFNLSSAQVNGIVIDSAMTPSEAIGKDSIVPAESLGNHRLIKPYLVVLPLVHHGYDEKVHLGQMVIHRYMAPKILALFVTMWKSNFPVQSVIPASRFGNNDELSMQANNSSGYRPERGSEHGKGSGFDINTFTNPFDVTGYDPTRPIQPAGAHYDPSAKGALVLQGPVQKKAAELHLEWGGNWGNPGAIPSTDFFRRGYFDWQHFQLGFQEYDTFEAQLPPGFES